MKRVLWIAGLLLGILILLVACGGGQAEPEPAAPADNTVESAPAASEQEAVESEPEETAPEEAAPAEEEAAAPAEPAEEASGDMVAGRPASGVDPETGLEINPATITPGVDFIVRGELVNHNLTPMESPEFMVISPAGVRYRIRSQAVNEIFFEDGTQPEPHEYKRGMLIQATVRQDENAGPTTLVNSTDLVLLQSE